MKAMGKTGNLPKPWLHTGWCSTKWISWERC